MIIDIRRNPEIEEINFISWLKYYNLPLLLVLSKADKLSKIKQNNRLKIIAESTN